MTSASVGAFDAAFGTRRGTVNPALAGADSATVAGAHALWVSDPDNPAAKDTVVDLREEISDGHTARALRMLNAYGPENLDPVEARFQAFIDDWRGGLSAQPHVVAVLDTLLSHQRRSSTQAALLAFTHLRQQAGMTPSLTPALKNVQDEHDARAMARVLPALADGRLTLDAFAATGAWPDAVAAVIGRWGHRNNDKALGRLRRSGKLNATQWLDVGCAWSDALKAGATMDEAIEALRAAVRERTAPATELYL